MPHTTDKRTYQELARLLYLGRLQTRGKRPALDPTDRGQLAFQALLFECLMSTREHPHSLEQPRKSAMASISGYLNAICHQPEHLEIHTNTACRILPYLHEDHGVCGIPGLRLIDVTCRRVRLTHLPTGARLDLVDPQRWHDMDTARLVFRQETSWYQRDGRSPLWRHNGLTDEEAARHTSWTYTASTPLRSALLMRSMPLWYRFDISPAWVPGNPTRPDQLIWDTRSDTAHDQVVELLTRSAARIPEAVYRPYDDHVTARHTLGSGPESSAPIGAAPADLLEDLPGVRLPDLAELRARGVLGSRTTPPPAARRVLGAGSHPNTGPSDASG